MAIYYVPAIWKDGYGVITHVSTMLLDNNTDVLQSGIKRTEASAVLLIEAGHELYTARYLYNKRWQQRARIHVVTEGNRKFLRSNHDNLETDNLDNMIPMHVLGV